jgi:hypothetical protein
MYTPSLNSRLQQILVNNFAEYKILLAAINDSDLRLIKQLLHGNKSIVREIKNLDN